MADQFVTDTSTIFDIGQTVVAKVTNLDEEKSRFLVSLRESELSLSEEESQARLIQGLKERKAVFDMMTCRGVMQRLWWMTKDKVFNFCILVYLIKIYVRFQGTLTSFCSSLLYHWEINWRWRWEITERMARSHWPQISTVKPLYWSQSTTQKVRTTFPLQQCNTSPSQS